VKDNGSSDDDWIVHPPLTLLSFPVLSSVDMLIPDQFRDELKKRYHTCTELFRHFWSSLNTRYVVTQHEATSQEEMHRADHSSHVVYVLRIHRTAAKLQRVHAALDEQYRLLQVIRTSLNARSYSQLVPLLNPLVASIEMCHETYRKWQEKEAKRAAGPIKRITNVAPVANTAGVPTPLAPQPHAHNNAANGDLDRDSKRIKL
jgi:hypothetical protein